MDLRSNEIVLDFGHDWVNIVNIRLWLRLIYSICHDSTVTYFFQHAGNKMTHSSCEKWHTLFFDTLFMLKMIHSVLWKERKRKRFFLIQIKNIWYYNVYIHKLKLSIKYFNLNITVTSHAEKVSIFTRQISDTRLSLLW